MKTLILFILLGMVFSNILAQSLHNTPINQTPNEKIPPNNLKVYVDQNGNFYPDTWETLFGTPGHGAYSLNTIAIRNDAKLDNPKPLGNSKTLSDFEKNELEGLTNELKSKERVFIFIHGYNTNEGAADECFNSMQRKIKMDQAKDEVIDFYWDGLCSHSSVVSFKIWFNAAGYSQLAGEFGLRKVLNTMENKDIIIISHSRGASVMLSALSSPPYNEKFKKETEEFHSIIIPNKIGLKENGNRITCIMLAPAVGLIDFTKPEDVANFRIFSPQVVSMHVTINPSDPVLKKFIAPLSDKFNPTNLGYDKQVYTKLRTIYSFLKFTDITDVQSHRFIDYINSSSFKTILIAEGIGVTP